MNNEHVVFLEPSCGDGRLITELIRKTSESCTPQCIIGYDIDPLAIKKSQSNLQGSSGVVLRCRDFLSLDRKQLLSELSHFDANSNKNVTIPRKRIRCDESKRGIAEICEQKNIIVIGGPPYSPKSLPEQFILHSIKELKAEVVVFILPQRCQRDADKIEKFLNAHVDQQWSYVNKELRNSLFYFQDTIITQPSILQYWYKR